MVSDTDPATHRPKTSVQTKAYWETRVSFNLALISNSEKPAPTSALPRCDIWESATAGLNAIVKASLENGLPSQGEFVRDQYAGDVSDVLKFAFLRALAGDDRTLGVAWYYAPGDDGRADGRHLEWRGEPAWRLLDAQLHAGLSALPERSVAALERAMIWPNGALFHRDPMPPCVERGAWGARKRTALDGADIVFLDPDNGIGAESEKHAKFSEIRLLRKPARAIVFITFPGRTMPHDVLLGRLHERLVVEADAQDVITLRTNISVPRNAGSRSYVQRQRWFTVIDPDAILRARAHAFATALASIPRVRARLDSTS